MRFKRHSLLAAGLFFLICLAGCGAEDGDLTPPGISFGSITPALLNSATSSNGPFTLAGSNGADATVTAYVYSPTADLRAEITDTDPLADSWEIVIPQDTLVEGFNTVSIEAADGVGNTRVLTFLISLDQTPPAVTMNQYTTPTPIPVQTLAGTVSELDATVEVAITGVNGGAFTPVDDISGGVWRYAVDLAPDAATPYTVQVRASDPLGNATDAVDYVTVDITVSSAADVLNIAEDDAGPVYVPTPATTASLTLTGTRTADYTVGVAGIIPSSPVLVDDDTDNVDWTAGFTALPAGTTEVTFALNDLTVPDPQKVAEARVLIVRDLSGPVLVDKSPAHGATGVSTATDITLAFSEPMQDIVNDGNFFRLVSAAGDEITFSSDPVRVDDRTFTFTPDAGTPLQPDTAYSVVFNTIIPFTTVTDLYDNAFIRPATTWSFRTGP